MCRLFGLSGGSERVRATFWLLEAPDGQRHLEQASAAGRVRVRSGSLASSPAVVVASEGMDEDPALRSLSPGELLHVDRHLQVHSTIAVEHPPTHQLTLDDLGHGAAAQKSG